MTESSPSVFQFDDEPLTDFEKPKQTSSLSTKQKSLLENFSAEDARKLANRASIETISASLKYIMQQIVKTATNTKSAEEQVTICEFIGQSELDILRNDLKYSLQIISSDKVIISWSRAPIDGYSLGMLRKSDRDLVSVLEKKQPKIFETVSKDDLKSVYGACALQMSTKKLCRNDIFDRIRLISFHTIQDAAKRKVSSVQIIPFSKYATTVSQIEKIVYFDMLISDLEGRGFVITDTYRHTPQQIVISFDSVPKVEIVGQEKKENKETKKDFKIQPLVKPKYFQNKEAFKTYCDQELQEYTSRVMQRTKHDDASQDSYLARLFESILGKMEYAYSAQPTEPAPWNAVS